MYRNLKIIRDILYKSTLYSMWNDEFYSIKDPGVTPCNSDYYTEKPFRILYDGIYQVNGDIIEFNVGIMSDSDSDTYEFFIEDYNGESLAEHFKTFDKALKRFVKLTYIRNPIIYIDDKYGNAVKIDYKVGPYSIINN